jgi:hypothetical protein
LKTLKANDVTVPRGSIANQVAGFEKKFYDKNGILSAAMVEKNAGPLSKYARKMLRVAPLLGAAVFLLLDSDANGGEIAELAMEAKQISKMQKGYDRDVWETLWYLRMRNYLNAVTPDSKPTDIAIYKKIMSILANEDYSTEGLGLIRQERNVRFNFRVIKKVWKDQEGIDVKEFLGSLKYVGRVEVSTEAHHYTVATRGEGTMLVDIQGPSGYYWVTVRLTIDIGGENDGKSVFTEFPFEPVDGGTWDPKAKDVLHTSKKGATAVVTTLAWHHYANRGRDTILEFSPRIRGAYDGPGSVSGQVEILGWTWRENLPFP